MQYVLIILLVLILGYVDYQRQERLRREGKIRSVRKSKGLADFMFYYFNEDGWNGRS